MGTLTSWLLLLKYGRRTLFTTGLLILTILQLLIGILDTIPSRPRAAIWAESSLMLIWNFFYDVSVGPICFVLLSECSATRVRSKTIAAATAAQGVLGIIMTVAIPYMINPEEANMRGKLGYFFGGLAALCLVWSYFRVPETMGRTYDELDRLFDWGVPARRFKGYNVDEEVIARRESA
jgi:MFS family permease